MDCSILPEGSDSKSLWPGWEESATILPARLRVLETGPGGMVGCSWSPSQWNEWYAAVCPCPWQWQQRTRWWWVRWRWTRWWQCRSAPSSSLADWTSPAAAESTSSAVLSWWGSWCSAPTWGPGWWWYPVSRRTPQSQLGSHTGWWWRVGLGSL